VAGDEETKIAIRLILYKHGYSLVDITAFETTGWLNKVLIDSQSRMTLEEIHDALQKISEKYTLLLT
jgi:ribosome maturation factor RimP